MHRHTDELFLDNEPHGGGWGASHGQAGEAGMIWTLSGNFHDTTDTELSLWFEHSGNP